METARRIPVWAPVAAVAATVLLVGGIVWAASGGSTPTRSLGAVPSPAASTPDAGPTVGVASAQPCSVVSKDADLGVGPGSVRSGGCGATATPSCGSGPAEGACAPASVASDPPDPCEPALFGQALSADAAAYPAGATVHMTLAVTWTGTTACTFTEGVAPGQFTVADASGRTVWAAGCSGQATGHSGPQACPALARLATYQPGQTSTFRQDWAQQVDMTPDRDVADAPAGRYTLSSDYAGTPTTTAVTLTR